MGGAPDISEWLEFGFYNDVQYWNYDKKMKEWASLGNGLATRTVLKELCVTDTQEERQGLGTHYRTMFDRGGSCE